MSEPVPPIPPDATPLQFGKAEFADAPSQVTCTACQRVIPQEYFEVNGAVVCAPCRGQLAAAAGSWALFMTTQNAL